MRVTFALVAACVVVRPLLAAPLQDTTQRDGEAKPSTVSVEDFREVAAQYWPVIVGPIAGAAGALAANEFFQRRLDNRAKSERSEDMKSELPRAPAHGVAAIHSPSLTHTHTCRHSRPP
jgi:hypothetical protein